MRGHQYSPMVRSSPVCLYSSLPSYGDDEDDDEEDDDVLFYDDGLGSIFGGDKLTFDE